MCKQAKDKIARQNLNPDIQDRRAEAIRIRPYFELQLRFAQLASARLDLPIEHCVLQFTNLYRRLSFGVPPPSPGQIDFIKRAGVAPTKDTLLDPLWTKSVRR